MILNSADCVRRLIELAGDDPNREGLKQTPMRVLKSYGQMFSGYEFNEQDIIQMLTVFEDKCDEMVILKDVELYSTCEHHMLPFIGVAHIGYVPNGQVVGISKLARVLEVYSRRLQIQERICQQVTDALMTYLRPHGAACILEAKHLCISCRGVNKQQSVMITSSMRGCFKDDLNTRTEFLRLIGK